MMIDDAVFQRKYAGMMGRRAIDFRRESAWRGHCVSGKGVSGEEETMWYELAVEERLCQTSAGLSGVCILLRSLLSLP